MALGRVLRGVVLGSALTAGSALAQSDPAEIAFWTAATQDNAAASYQAYLDTFPNGRFAALATLRIARLASNPVPAPMAASISLRTARPSVRLVDGVVVDMDARGLRNGSNWRLAVVPADTPDGQPADMAGFVQNSVAVTNAKLHLTIPAGPPGQDEVRLYWIPGNGDIYAVAARATLTVQPGVRGAVLMRDLGDQAAKLGPIRFEAAHRDRPLLIQAAFLRVRPQSEWNLAWFNGTAVQIARPMAVISIGQVGALPDQYGSLGEGICMIDVAGTGLDVIAAMSLGDPVLVRAVPTSWSNAGPDAPVLLKSCELVR